MYEIAAMYEIVSKYYRLYDEILPRQPQQFWGYICITCFCVWNKNKRTWSVSKYGGIIVKLDEFVFKIHGDPLWWHTMVCCGLLGRFSRLTMLSQDLMSNRDDHCKMFDSKNIATLIKISTIHPSAAGYPLSEKHFRVMIWIRAWSSFDGIVFIRYSRSTWVRL